MTDGLGEARLGIAMVLTALGEDPTRNGLVETPERYVKMMAELTAGYDADPAAILKTFDGPESYDQMITVGPIPFYSLCEHHLVPFFGNAWVSYIPNGHIVGLSKMARLLEVFSRRLQVQERLTDQVASTLYAALDCGGSACLVKARHLCMEMRGVKKAGAFTTTTALYGAYRENADTRQEFLSSCVSG